MPNQSQNILRHHVIETYLQGGGLVLDLEFLQFPFPWLELLRKLKDNKTAATSPVWSTPVLCDTTLLDWQPIKLLNSVMLARAFKGGLNRDGRAFIFGQPIFIYFNI